uniref:Pyruvate dehydrogenase E1 component subunit beta n=1 Tax=Anotrichium furcellatum TaxID=41999 RepID=A0A4D6WJA8_9FLOR|nr:Pyruvate dehydrogenase E1 component beta subunit [Anotrichium furcellatum]
MNQVFMFDALREATDEEMKRDPTVFVLGEDVGHYGGSYKVTKDLHKKYGDLRVLDTPIAENSFMGMAIGSAITGLRPIVEGMNMSFLLLAFNQISNNAGMLRYTSGGNFQIPIVIRGPGGVGRQLGAEHSQRLEAYFQAIPGLKIVACSTPYNAKGLLKSAIRDHNPVIFFEHVLLYNLREELPSNEYFIPLDKAELVRSGKDVTILTYSRMRHHVVQAVKQLVEDGYDPEVLDLISLKPIDISSIINSLSKTNYLIIVEECMRTGGIAAEIIAQVNDQAFDLLDAPIVRLSSEDIPTPYNGSLEEATIIHPKEIIDTVKRLVKHKIPLSK